MIGIHTGAPGNGKSMVAQTWTIAQLIQGDRDIVTATPARVEPWCTSDGRAMIGLRHYLMLKAGAWYAQNNASEWQVVQRSKLVATWGPMMINEDEGDLGSLFLWRRAKKTGIWFKLSWNEEKQQFNPKQLSASRGCYVVTDEAWKCYNSRDWKSTQKVVEFYGRQHRKFGDEWILVSHGHKDLDVQLNRMAQCWTQCTNHGLRRLSIFRQPRIFTVKTFYEPPSSANARCMREERYLLDPLIVQTYDTSAGVAVGGGRAADVNHRTKGLHWSWLLVGCLVLFSLFWFAPNVAGHFAKNKYAEANRPSEKRGQHKSAPTGARTQSGAPTNAPPQVEARVVVQTNLSAVQVIGWVPSGNHFRVLLSDGRSADSRLCSYLGDQFAVIDGERMRVRPGVVVRR